MNSKKNGPVLIIGCGWLGKKLGSYLISKKLTVYGTTRSSSNFSELNALEIKPVKLELPSASLSDIRLPDVKTVIISISPGRGKDRNDYPKIIGQLSQVLAERNVQIIMYSSTSVYEDTKNEVTESDAEPEEKSNNAIIAAEGALIKYSPDAVILRLSGLYGEDRHPAKYMAGRKNIAGGDSPVNLVHSDDVIQVTAKIIEKKIKGEIFNVCSGSHPSRSEIYTKIAERLELKKPTFEEGGSDGKKVSSEKLKKQLKIRFLHPEPSEFLAD
ncbi:MAG: NAD-dependent epimerase/dehydratase family protein [Gracilimonas sp.]|nr:NAD-dependent epimerase/dehydratase family protein [Gracilimonas sp.]